MRSSSFVRGGPPLHFPGQGGVAHQPPAQHEMGHGGKVPGPLPAGLHGEEVAVIAQGQVRVLRRVSKGLLPHRSPVVVGAQAGVDDELTDGIAGKDRQQGGPLLRVGDPDAGFHRHPQVQPAENLVEKGIQLLGTGQKARPFSFGHHGAGGAAHVQVDLLIAKVPEQAGSRDEILRPVGEQLGDHRHAPVVVRVHVGQPPAGEGTVCGGGKEGGIVAVQAREHLVVELAVEPAGDPLQRGQGEPGLMGTGWRHGHLQNMICI